MKKGNSPSYLFIYLKVDRNFGAIDLCATLIAGSGTEKIVKTPDVGRKADDRKISR